jgi:hypothetical protein
MTKKEKRLGGPAGGARAERAYEALPQTPPGGKPPETPAPFPWTLDYTERQRFVKGSQAAHKPRALDKALALRRVRCEEGKGAFVTRGRRVASRWSAVAFASGCGDAARSARMRRCLKLRQGASPLRPPDCA